MMKTLLLLASLILAGCSLQAPSATDVRLISEHYEDGRAHLKYEVLCPGDDSEYGWRPVDYYGAITVTDFGGFVFESKEALLQYEYYNSCRGRTDGDGPGFDSPGSEE